MRNTPHKNLMIGLLFAASAGVAYPQFVAYNDHYVGPDTHPNATAWNVFGTTGGAPGRTGPLKNIVTGANLPVTLNITNTSGVGGGQSSGSPAVGTPAYGIFDNYVDFGSGGGVNHAVTVNATAVMGHVFTGLNPSKRYKVRVTGVRGNPAYTNRWILVELAEADSYQSAHTANVLTSDQVPTIAANEAALNTGVNHTYETGDVIGWDEIAPGSDGRIVLYSRQYRGEVPGGTSLSSYGYGLTALRLEEVLATPVTIVTPPQNTAVCPGQAVSFDVTATGSQPFTYQWRKGTTPISNATNRVYTIANAVAGDAGSYSVVVTNPRGSVTSSGATLTVSANPVVISQHPQNQTVPAETPASFSVGVTASSSYPIAFQWYKNSVANNRTGTALPGATNEQLVVAAAGPANVGYYYVRLQNCINVVTSTVASLSVTYTPITITQQPQDSTVPQGGSVTLNVSATGSSPQYQWYKGNNPIPNATNDSLTLNNVRITDSASYSVLVSNPAGSVRSAEAAVIVSLPPYVLLPWNHIWRYNQFGDCLGSEWTGINYPAANSWPAGPGAMALENQAFVNSIRGTVLSLTSPTTSQRVRTYYFRSTFVLTNEPDLVSITASNVMDDSAVVYLNGTEVYRINLPAPPTRILCDTAANGAYGEGTVLITNIPSSLLVQGENVIAVEVHQVNLTSSDVVFGLSLEVNFPPPTFLAITNQPENVVVEEAKPATFEVGYVGTQARFQWFKRQGQNPPVAIPGATKATYTITNTVFGVDDGYYFVVLSNIISQVTSREALLVVRADTNPPALFDADGTLNTTNIIISFTEAIQAQPASPAMSPTNVANYTVTNTFGESLTVRSAVFTNGTNVILTTTTGRLPDRNYIVTVKTARDTGPRHNLANNIAAPVATRRVAIPMLSYWEFAQPLEGIDDTTDFDNGAWRSPTYNPHNPSNPSVWSWSPDPGITLFYIPSFGSSVEYPIPNGTALSQGSFTTYLIKDFGYSGSPAGATFRMRYVVDDGAVFYFNGTEIDRYNMPEGPIARTTPAVNQVRDATLVDWIEIPASLSKPGSNRVSVELHGQIINELDLAFALEMEARVDSIITGKVVITRSPLSLTVYEGDPAEFDFKGVAGRSFLWKSNTIAIGGATNPVYRIARTPLSANGARYSVLVTGPSNSVETAQATLTVLTDTNAPTLFSAYLTTPNQITVSFSEPVSAATAANRLNYAVTNAIGANLNVTGASLVNGTNVVLTVSSLPPGVYTVVVNNVRDTSSGNNVIVENSRVTVGLDELTVVTMTAPSTNNVTTWRFNQQDVDLGTAWRNTDYNDNVTGWQSGKALFEVDRGTVRTQLGGIPVLTRLTLEGADGQDIPSYYFRTWFNLPVFGEGATMTVRHLLDDGMAFWLNGELAYAIGVPVPVVFGFGGVRTVGDGSVEGPFNVPTTNLVAGMNLVAAQAKNVNATSSDAAFGMELKVTIPSVVLPAGGSTVVPPPTNVVLHITRQDPNVRVWWTNAYTPVTLQATTVLTPPNTQWTNVTVQGQSYTVPATNAARYFRLKY